MDPRLNDLRNKGEYNFGEQDGTRSPNKPGVYYHPQANKFIETGGMTMPDGSIVYDMAKGKIQADAFRQMGYQAADKEQLEHYQAKKAEALKANAKKEVYDLSKPNPHRPVSK